MERGPRHQDQANPERNNFPHSECIFLNSLRYLSSARSYVHILLGLAHVPQVPAATCTYVCESLCP